jgi:hypothetical protein
LTVGDASETRLELSGELILLAAPEKAACPCAIAALTATRRASSRPICFVYFIPQESNIFIVQGIQGLITRDLALPLHIDARQGPKKPARLPICCSARL